jgi:glycosyltransferase involved in cell wall biosynthesis
MPEALFVAHRFFDSNRERAMGGAEIHLGGMIDVVRRHGFQVKVIQNWRSTETIYEEDGLTVLGVRGSNIFPGVNLRWRRGLTKETELIHFNMMVQAVPFANGRTTASCHGLTWDIPLRGVDSRWLPTTPLKFRAQRWLLRKWNWFAARYAVNHCRKVLSVDSSLLRLIQHAIPDRRDKVEVIPNFVDVERFRPGDEPTLREELGFAPDDIVVFFPRNISLQRGYHILDELVHRLRHSHPQVKFLVAGRGIVQGEMAKGVTPHSSEGRLAASLQEAGLTDQVRFIGSVPHDGMPRLYRAADLVIIPTYFSEGTSLSALEAMATGKPLIVSNIGGLTDLVLDGYSGLVVRPHANEFADKIIETIERPQLAAERAGRALEIARAAYNQELWESRIERFLGLGAS